MIDCTARFSSFGSVLMRDLSSLPAAGLKVPLCRDQTQHLTARPDCRWGTGISGHVNLAGFKTVSTQTIPESACRQAQANSQGVLGFNG